MGLIVTARFFFPRFFIDDNEQIERLFTFPYNYNFDHVLFKFYVMRKLTFVIGFLFVTALFSSCEDSIKLNNDEEEKQDCCHQEIDIIDED